MRARIMDLLGVPAFLLFAPFAARVARARGHAPLSRSILDRHGFALVPHHYYDPVVFPSDIRGDLGLPRRISGLDLNEQGQLDLIRQFKYRDELLAIPMTSAAPTEYAYANGSFGSGNSELLYDMIRHFKPRRIVEIGSGYSTLMASLAIKKNLEEGGGAKCELTCVEPFEHPVLERLGLKVIRQKVEHCPAHLFTALDANDILFINSSHVIRPQGDVTHEYLHILGLLRPGVIVHVHDIFTPRDYPKEWVLDTRWLWNEQYLLEAFLCFNTAFEVICAANWLARNHMDKLGDACPVLCQEPTREPGSFWFRRKV